MRLQLIRDGFRLGALRSALGWGVATVSVCDTINQAVNAPDSPQISAMLALSYKNVNKFAYLYQTEDVTRPG